jgi:hypothetical protein
MSCGAVVFWSGGGALRGSRVAASVPRSQGEGKIA